VISVTLPLVHFAIPLEIVIVGALIGTTYALFGMGLTLAYQSSRAINFAQGAMGVLPHFLLAFLVIDHGWGYWPALVVALGVAIGSGALLELVVIRRLAKAPRLVVLVATLGAGQLLMIPMFWFLDLSKTKLGTATYPVPFDATLSVGNIRLQSAHLLIMFVAPALLIGLTLFLRRTTVGIASRASAENAEAAALSGIPVHRISTLVWVLAGLLAGSAAILVGGTRPILSTTVGADNTFVSSADLLLRGLGAAMMGGLMSLPQVFLAGVSLGVIEGLIRWNFPGSSGTLQLVMMVIIIGSLLGRRSLRQAARGGEETNWSLAGTVRALPQRVRRLPQVRAAHVGLLSALGLAFLVLPLAYGPGQRVVLTAILLYVLMGLSLVILTGWAGQVTLGHFSFVALAAYVGARMHESHYPLFGGLVIAVAAVVALAVVVGLPALRMKGIFLAVTTLACAVVVDSWLIRQPWLGGQASITSAVRSRLPRPEIGGVEFQSELRYYYLALGIVVVAMVVTHQLRKSGIARRFRAVRDNELMAASLGISPAASKLLAFVVSGAMAAIAGYFYGALLVDFTFARISNPDLSLRLVTMVILGGPTSITGAVLGALYVRGIPYFFESSTANLLTSGVGLLVALLILPGGLASPAFRLRDWFVAKLVGARDEVDADADVRVSELRLTRREREHDDEAPAVAIEAQEVTVRYGGLVALDRVSICAGRGEIVGLIGPNGAGKTTLFDVLSGFTKPESGTLRLLGEDVTHRPVDARARMGLGRSFQQARLFEDMTVFECFEVALERHEPSELVPSMLALPPATSAERRKEQRAGEIVELLGLGRFAERKAGELSTGTRRIAELGCMIAMGAEVLLLDEPTGGIAQSEVPAFCRVVRQIRDHLDATIVVVGHDIPMMVELVDRVYVLAGGVVIAEGEPGLLQTDPAVMAAYFGTDEEPESVVAETRLEPVMKGSGVRR
jgi:ABC-type branched-subunit amino acid transport system ATPase component/ABC-type branched-subunit amino acid transport system permease subunit